MEDFGLGLTHDNATKKVHTRQADIELSQLIAVRIFVPDESRRKVQILHTRLTKGDLVAADDRTQRLMSSTGARGYLQLIQKHFLMPCYFETNCGS